MNEPLKVKLFSIYGQILNTKTLTAAWEHVKSNKGCGGVDGVSIKDFDKNAAVNIEALRLELVNKTYKPSPVQRRFIPKKNGKMRPLGIPTIKDRIVQQALVDRLQPFFEVNVFNDHSYGFRPKRSVQTAIEQVLRNLEWGCTYIYDFDIKGFFDNIPHKKLMKVLNKYISDGTVLDIIWRSLKAGYMLDDVLYETPSGTMQGGVISPLLANIYLNELDWELEKAGLNAVRYADDSIVMCKTPEELEKAKAVVGRVLLELGLELAPDKTHDVDFYQDDFEYLGFVFRHLHYRRDGELRYYVGPSNKSVDKFRGDVKGKTCKTFSKSFEEWSEALNPVIRGKINYFLISVKACMAVRREWYAMGGDFHGVPVKGLYRELDGYIRQRLRVNFANRGKRHAKFKDGMMLNLKYNNEFFVKTMKLVSGDFLYQSMFNSKLTADLYLSRIKRAPRRRTPQSERYFYYASRR